jgi:hypothetical protein
MGPFFAVKTMRALVHRVFSILPYCPLQHPSPPLPLDVSRPENMQKIVVNNEIAQPQHKYRDCGAADSASCVSRQENQLDAVCDVQTGK